MNSQPRRSARFQFLLRPAMAVCFVILGAVPCSAQTFFSGNGDGSSWNDGSNWSFDNVPVSGNARIIGSSVQINSPTGFSGELGVCPRLIDNDVNGNPVFRSGSLSVNAPLSQRFFDGEPGGPPSVSANDERATINVNADIVGTVSAIFGGTINLNAGTITTNDNCLSIGSNCSFNQNGGHFNVSRLFLRNSDVTLTVGPSDSITDCINVFGGSPRPHLILDRPINLTDIMTIGSGAETTINHDLSCNVRITIQGSGGFNNVVLNWNAGVISTPQLLLNDVIVNRTESGHLDVEEFFFGVFNGVAPNVDEEFIIREDDLIAGRAVSSGGGELTIESPHTFETLELFKDSIANYQQEPGESEGLTVDSLLIFTYLNLNPILNLGFDSQSTGGLDWVLRTATQSVSQIEDLIEDGNIVVTGAEFEVVNDPATGFTYIQAVQAAVLLGDCDLNGQVNFLDIAPFIAVLSNGDFLAQADCNESGEVNFLDIAPFIAILSGS